MTKHNRTDDRVSVEDAIDVVPDHYTLARIDDGLYLGSLPQAQNLDLLIRHGITHVLTCMRGMNSWLDGSEIEERLHKRKIKHQFVEVDDLETEDFLQHFDMCADFIHDALHDENGAVLVHYQAGISRSSTAITAYLIRERDMSVEEALQYVTERKGDIDPNSGFRRQLTRYHIMKLRSRREKHDTHELSRQELLQQRLQRISQASSIPVEHRSDGEHIYCKMCRYPLFTTDDLVSHEAEAKRGRKDFSFRKLKKDRSNNDSGFSGSKCCAYSVDRMEWMGDLGEANEGKLLCPNGHRVGSFTWSGTQCSCGVWVRPSFAVLKNRVD